MNRLACVLLAALPACSLLHDTDDLRLPLESPAFDASVTLDAQAPLVVRDPASPCNRQHLFCADFDSSDDTQWTEVTGADRMRLDEGMFSTAPRSLGVALGTTTTPSQRRKTLTIQKRKFELSAHIRVDGADTSANLAYLVLSFGPAPGGQLSHGLALVDRAGKPALQFFDVTKTGRFVHEDASCSITNGVWHHVVLSVSYAQSPPVGRIDIDGKFRGSMDLDGAPPKEATIDVGIIPLNSAASSHEVHIDDVVLDED